MKKKEISYCIIILVAFFALYIPSLDYSFQFDDTVHISENTQILNFDQYKSVSFWTSHLRRPLSKFSFSVSELWAHGEPGGHRFFNIILHLLNGILVFFLSGKILKHLPSKSVEKSDITTFALVTTAIFLLHPLQIQSVVYIVQRMNLLSAFFTLLSLLSYLSAREAINNNRIISFIGLLIVAAALIIPGILSKQNAAVVPFIIIGLEFILFKGKTSYEKVLRVFLFVVFPLFIISAALFLGIPKTSTSNTSPLYYLISQFPVLLKYIRLFVLPTGLNIDYWVTPFKGTVEAQYIISAIIHLLIIGFLIFRKKTPEIIRLGFIWFYMAHIIESGIIPIDDIMVEHRNYLPLLGLSFIIIYLIFYLIKKNKYRTIALASLLIYFTTFTAFRIPKWESMVSIWDDSITNTPMNKRAWNNLSYALLEKDPIKAKKIALKALEFDEEYFQAYDNLGAAQLILGDTVEASKSFKKSIQYKKDNFPALFNYGICLENMAPDSAIFYFQKVLSIHPGHLDARIQLGTILLKSRKYQAAIPHLLIACNADAGCHECILHLVPGRSGTLLVYQ